MTKKRSDGKGTAIVLLVSWIIVVVLVVADQLLKYWAVTALEPVGSKPFFHIGDTDIIGLHYLENDGAVFGSFSGARWILVAITAVLILACAIGLIRYPKRSKWLSAGLILVIAGGVGNLIDRLFRGGLVVDYIEVRLFHFAIFNFADCCVVVGVILLLAYFLFADTWKKHKQKQLETLENSSEIDEDPKNV